MQPVFWRSVPSGVTLEPDPDTGRWRFTASTLTFIPKPEEKLAKKVEPPKPAVSKVAAAGRSPRATMRTFLEAMNAEPQDLGAAVECLDPTGQDPEAWTVLGVDLATKLKNVIDKTKLVVHINIPDEPEDEKYVCIPTPPRTTTTSTSTDSPRRLWAFFCTRSSKFPTGVPSFANGTGCSWTSWA